MKLIIAEKPSVAAAYVAALGVNGKKRRIPRGKFPDRDLVYRPSGIPGGGGSL